jgi:hypothetical protein
MTKVWEREVERGRAGTFTEIDNNKRYLLIQNPEIGNKDYDYTVVLGEEEIESADQEIENFLKDHKVEGGFIDFSEVCWCLMDKQTQYGFFYISGVAGSPALGTGLRFKGDEENYNSMKIYKGDINLFMKRYLRYRKGITSGKTYGL